MKFKGVGIVWDAEKDQPLVKFEDGEAEVKDKRAQEILKKLGYEAEKEEKKSEK